MKWTIREDEIVVLFYLKFKEDWYSHFDELERDFTKEGFVLRKKDSLKMRVQNVQYIDTEKGLANYARQTKEVYDRLTKGY